jgi:hypothetical protein
VNIAAQLDSALVERSYAASDVPGVFWLALEISKHSLDKAKDVVRGKLTGLSGISDSKGIVLNWLGVGRNALLVMPGDDAAKLNKLTRVLYDNPEYMVSNDFAALYRLWDKKRGGVSGDHGMMQNLVDYVRPALSRVPSKAAATVAYAIERGDLSSSKFGSLYRAQSPKIGSIADAARFMRRAAIEIAEGARYANYVKEARAVTLDEWAKALREGLKAAGAIYRDEGEWIVKGDSFQIPESSKLVILRPKMITMPYINAYMAGGKQAMFDLGKKNGEYKENLAQIFGEWDGFPGEGVNWKAFADTLEVIKETGIDKRYDLRFVNHQQFDARRNTLLAQR